MSVMQILSDHGLNPFAAKLLTESYNRHEKKCKVSFVLDKVRVTLEEEKGSATSEQSEESTTVEQYNPDQDRDS